MNRSRFVEIRAVEQVRNAIAMAQRLRCPSLVIGDPGTGKTTALKSMCPEVDGIYCEVTLHTKTAGGLYRMLLAAFGFRTERQYTYQLGEICYARLPELAQGYVLLIDEYQNFEPRVLRELLSIHERCDIPLVLSGNTERLARAKADTAAMEQINSRIGMRVRLGRPTAQDCESIGVEFNVEGRDAYQALISFGTASSVRELVRILELCVQNTGGVGSIQRRHIETAIVGLYGRRDALDLLKAQPS